jgi:hypothetical protein
VKRKTGKNAVTKIDSVPPFVPAAEPTRAKETGPMVVMTVRIAPKTRDAIKALYRKNLTYNSVSHVIQVAVDQFLAAQG